MDILTIIPYVPNLIRVRPYNLIRSLAGRGHRITLLTLYTGEAERRTLEQVRPYCHRLEAFPLPRWRSLASCLAALPTRRPLQSAFCWQPDLARRAAELAAGGSSAYTAVHVEHLRGAVYGLHLKKRLARQGRVLPVVWDSVDSISLLFRQARAQSRSLKGRLMTWMELGRTEYFEGWLPPRFDHVTVTSPADQRALQALVCPEDPGPAYDISVLPNGVDLDYFRPDPSVSRQPDTLVLSGKMSYHANVTMALYFTREIMPLVWAQRPACRLTIVGKDPAREVLALGDHPNVIVTGEVPHLTPYLQRAAVAVSPIAYGAGIQNKVLEAMACAAPVVATPQAVSAIQARHGQEVLVAADAPAFAGEVLRLLADPALQRQVGEAGRCYVETHHNWSVAAARLEEIYRRPGGRSEK